jgi:mRNA interferase HigB
MHVISKKPLLAFAKKHPAAREKVLAWHKLMEACKAKDFTELKQTFKTADYVPEKFTVFDVGGNNCRIVAVVIYDIQTVYVRFVGTHTEYDKWSKDNRKK